MLFIVWPANLEDQAGIDDFRFGRDLSALFHAPAHNILAVKASDWIGL